ncbi:MAG: 3-isopropylmalate dehydratase small subunit, partial [Actinomycetota bacterium]
MEAVRTVRGRAVPLDRSDVDTDQIIPAVWLKRVERTGFGAGLFSAWREDPAFVLNRPEYAGATILVAGPNFGSGSSREHAAWALEDYGFRAVVSSRFADIFRTNALKIGLVPAEVPGDVAEDLLRAVEADPSLEVVVDVEERRVSAPAAGIDAAFPLDDFTQWR